MKFLSAAATALALACAGCYPDRMMYNYDSVFEMNNTSDDSAVLDESGRDEVARTNQIRRHLASVRFPVVGDRVFGLKSARDLRFMQVPRQMLHASTLELPDPASPREKIRAHSPMPADFRATLRLFGLGKR